MPASDLLLLTEMAVPADYNWEKLIDISNISVLDVELK